MTPDRRQQINDLYRSASTRPFAELEKFLAEACGDDRDLRTQVESLLATQSIPSPHPTQLGPYKIETLLGAGGMGQVYRAIDTRLNRPVALKLSAAHFSNRFEREARAISALNHPNICTLYDVGPNYLVMELLDGPTLADEIKKGPMDPAQVARYGSQIAAALAEAHAHGIVHRDLKPGNIMVTRHGLKVLDFGLAKMDSDAGLTETNVVMGTPAYMAPEQVAGSDADPRTDLFALGLILYEMTAGKPPFPGKSLGRALLSGPTEPIPQLADPRLSKLVTKLLEKDPAKRCSSAAEVAASLTPRPAPTKSARSVFIPIALAALIAIAAGIWFYQRVEQRRWAREVAPAEITRLTAHYTPLAAFDILQRAEQILPNDPHFEQSARDLTTFVNVTSPTPGAKVEIQDYVSPNDPWLSLGVTPIQHARIPKGYFRWRLSAPGKTDFITAPVTADAMNFAFPETPGMTPVPGGPWGDLIGFIGWLGYQLPPFDIDQYEVTNHDYQTFIDQGGYQKREFWKEKFIKDGKELTFEQAMDLFRDPTGRPGPSTWDAGHFPAGHDNDPVSGVSWYEASAYTAFANKTLPAMSQWYKSAPAAVTGYAAAVSNFGGKGPLPVGASHAVGPYGTYDLAGNVREWSLNTIDQDKRLILGGAWGTQLYQTYVPEALPPFDRSPMNGFRGVRNREPLPAAVAAPIKRSIRDFSQAKPAADDVFRVIKGMYNYDKRPLNPQPSGAPEDTPDWTKQKITIDAGYENEHLPMLLFTPKNVKPPYQTVVFFPSARVNFLPTSDHLGDLDFIDYVIKSGRALLYPIYRGTYERKFKDAPLPGEAGDRELTIQQSKEVRRAVDYLATRSEIIDGKNLAYIGVSQGTAYGVIYTALEDRFKAIVFLDGGYFLNQPPQGRDQADFAPRIKQPVLMVNGKYDFTFPPDEAQAPLFRMLGTPPADKSRKVLDTPHDVTQRKPELSQSVLEFLDKYLGRVN